MRTADDFLSFVDEALAGMVEIVTSLGDDLANRRLADGVGNSPYVLLTHCLGVLEWWGGHAIAGRPIERDRDAEFVASGPVAVLVDRVPASRQRLAHDLSSFDPDGPLRGATDPEDDGLPFVETQAGALVHVIRELSQHLGQMESIRDGLLASGPS